MAFAQAGRAAGDPGHRPVLRDRRGRVRPLRRLAGRRPGGDRRPAHRRRGLPHPAGDRGDARLRHRWSGLVNGLITTMLKVPSFITTLGMLLVLLRRHPALDRRRPHRQPLRGASGQFGRCGIEHRCRSSARSRGPCSSCIALGAGAVCSCAPASAASSWPRATTTRRRPVSAGPRRRRPHRRIRALRTIGDGRRHPHRRLRRASPPRSATASSSPPSPRSCSAVWCSAAGAARCSPPWPERSPSRPCSRLFNQIGAARDAPADRAGRDHHRRRRLRRRAAQLAPLPPGRPRQPRRPQLPHEEKDSAP